MTKEQTFSTSKIMETLRKAQDGVQQVNSLFGTLTEGANIMLPIIEALIGQFKRESPRKQWTKAEIIGKAEAAIASIRAKDARFGRTEG